MFPEENRGRQEKINKIVYELSEKIINEDEDTIRKYLNRFVEIYKDNYKHKYSDFFPIILEISKEENKYNSEFLANNLDKLGTYIEEEYSNGNNSYSDINAQFIKLCDHLNLQISQINYFTMTEKKTNDVSTELQEASDKLARASINLEEANKRASSTQTELISILSIFAAIVLSFSGGFTLLGSAVTAVSSAKHYESIVLLTIICGMILFDTIFLMMYLVAKITDRNIYARCMSKDCAGCQNGKCSAIKRIRKRLPYVFYFNMLGMLGIILDMLVWFMDINGIII